MLVFYNHLILLDRYILLYTDRYVHCNEASNKCPCNDGCEYSLKCNLKLFSMWMNLWWFFFEDSETFEFMDNNFNVCQKNNNSLCVSIQSKQ